MSPRFNLDVVGRFTRGYTVAENGCWEWTRAKSAAGYGQLGLNGKVEYAHRVSWELFSGGPIPAGLQIDHLCRNRGCVNPLHLEAVDQATNIRRGGQSLKTHCPHGHPYDEENTQRWRGSRACKICLRKRQRELYLKRKARGYYSRGAA